MTERAHRSQKAKSDGKRFSQSLSTLILIESNWNHDMFNTSVSSEMTPCALEFSVMEGDLGTVPDHK